MLTFLFKRNHDQTEAFNSFKEIFQLEVEGARWKIRMENVRKPLLASIATTHTLNIVDSNFKKIAKFFRDLGFLYLTYF